jgi:hypothetical protein
LPLFTPLIASSIPVDYNHTMMDQWVTNDNVGWSR